MQNSRRFSARWHTALNTACHRALNSRRFNIPSIPEIGTARLIVAPEIALVVW